MRKRSGSHVHVCKCARARASVCAHACVLASLCVRASVCLRACVWVYVRLCACVCIGEEAELPQESVRPAWKKARQRQRVGDAAEEEDM